MAANQDLRQYIDIINENLQEKEHLNEAGGLIDVGLAKLGSRSAKGRIERKNLQKDMIGNWREYASRLGIDKSEWFSQKQFPRDEFVGFLKSQYGFDDDMIDAVGIRKAGKSDVKTVFTKAADVLSRTEANIGTFTRKTEQPTSKIDIDRTSTIKSQQAGREKQVDEIENYVKKLKGNVRIAINNAKEIASDGQRIAAMNDLEKLGFALLKVRGKI